MTRLFCIHLTLLFSLNGIAMGANGDFGRSSIAANMGAGTSEEMVTLNRGVSARHPGRAAAVEASAIPWGGTAVTSEYNAGNTNTETIRGSDWGGGVGGILYTITPGASGPVRSYNAYNSRGDVVSTTGDAGDATWQASYEAFGTRTAEDGSNTARQRANTKEEDPTGLLNEGMRYRDLAAGVFISRDPAGFVDGPNVYTYVRQNPWTAFDPEGLDMARAGTALTKGNYLLAALEYTMVADTIRTYDVAKYLGNTATGSYGLARESGDSKASATAQSAVMVVSTVSGVRDLTEGITGAEMNYSGGKTGAVDDIRDQIGKRVVKTASGILQVSAVATGIQQAAGLGASAKSTLQTVTKEVTAAKKPAPNAKGGEGNPSLRDDPYSPDSVSRRQSETRRQLGVEPDPNAPIPNQPPGENIKGTHTADTAEHHATGERNVGTAEEHSRVAKGSNGMPRRRR
jgi:RHS repeat-associated protein